MMGKSVVLLFWTAALGMLIACAQGMSDQVLSQVTFTGSFSQLQANPERYQGEMVLLGGKIIETQPLDKGTELVVLQLELDRSDRPQEDRTRGRFLVRSAQLLDPAVYSPGARITVVGRVIGSEQKNIGRMPYRYPVIHPEEIRKWSESVDGYPRFHFGVGIGTTF